MGNVRWLGCLTLLAGLAGPLHAQLPEMRTGKPVKIFLSQKPLRGEWIVTRDTVFEVATDSGPRRFSVSAIDSLALLHYHPMRAAIGSAVFVGFLGGFVGSMFPECGIQGCRGKRFKSALAVGALTAIPAFAAGYIIGTVTSGNWEVVYRRPQ